MKWFALSSVLALGAILLAGGCAQTKSTPKQEFNAVEYRYIEDTQAHAKGYPDVFVSQDNPKVDWSKSHKEVIGGEEFEVVDMAVVEVCGGCDR